MQIEFAVLEQRRHLIPSLVHAPPVDTLDSDALKNNVLGKVERDWLGGKTKERNAPPATYDVERCSNRVGMPGHFEHRVDTQAVGSLHDDRSHVLLRRVERQIGVHLFRKLSPVVVYF